MKIKSLKLWTPQLDVLSAFYRDMLGLISSARAGKTEVYAGYTRITLHQTEAGFVHHPYHFAFNIPENQFEEAKAWLAQRAVLIKDNNGEDTFDFLSWNAHACYCYDPDGNIVELIARHSLVDSASTQPFSGRSLLGASEIGLVADDVRETTRLLCTKFGLGVYDGAGSDTFSAIGNEQGLFIVVKRGREWFPSTGNLAAACQLSVAFELNGALHSWEVADNSS